MAEWREGSGAIHYHILIVGWIPSDGLKADIVKAGFGHVYDISTVKSVKRVTRYVTTYITKTASLHAPRYVNRYSSSRGGLPPLVLWRALRRAGYAEDLSDSADGKAWSLAAENEVWWTGGKRREIEALLEVERWAANDGADPPRWKYIHAA